MVTHVSKGKQLCQNGHMGKLLKIWVKIITVTDACVL